MNKSWVQIKEVFSSTESPKSPLKESNYSHSIDSYKSLKRLWKNNSKYKNRSLRLDEDIYVSEGSDDENENIPRKHLSNSDQGFDNKRIKLSRGRLNISINDTRISDNASSSDDISYDPDFDHDACNGCYTPLVRKKPLDFFKNRKQIDEIYNKITQTLNENDISYKNRYKPRKNWTFIFNTQERNEGSNDKSNDVRFLESSIINTDSDNCGSEKNSQNIPGEIDVTHISCPSSQSSQFNPEKIDTIIEEDTHISVSRLNQVITVDSSASVSPQTISTPVPAKPYKKIKKIRLRRGGLAEKLQITLNREKSNFAFWSHELQCGLIEVGAIITIIGIQKLYGKTWITFEWNHKNAVLCLDPSDKIVNNLYPGLEIGVEFDSPCYHWNGLDVYLAVKKIQINKKK